MRPIMIVGTLLSEGSLKLEANCSLGLKHLSNIEATKAI